METYNSLFSSDSEIRTGDQYLGLYMVDKYLDVFLKILPWIQLDREIEFCINLVPKAQPVSITPYQMVPTKLAELRKQLNKLCEKYYLRSSTSPWEALVLFVRKEDGYVDYQKLN